MDLHGLFYATRLYPLNLVGCGFVLKFICVTLRFLGSTSGEATVLFIFGALCSPRQGGHSSPYNNICVYCTDATTALCIVVVGVMKSTKCA